MTTNNAESWAAEMDRTEPYSDSITSEEKPEGFLNPEPLAEVQKNIVSEGPEGTLNPKSLAEVQKINLNTEVGRQCPEEANLSPEVANKDEFVNISTRHVGSNTEEVLDSVANEVGLTCKYILA